MHFKLSIWLLALSALAVAPAHADDASDANLAKQCPATSRWVAAHAKQSHANSEAVPPGEKRRVEEPKLRDELAVRYADDQKVRNDWIAAHYSKASSDAVAAVDAKNIAWLRALVSKQGFPTVAQVGQKGVDHAWMLLQHATGDPGFQTRVFFEIKPRLESYGISKQDFALLEDRVLLEEGKSQIYGSQFKRNKNGELELRPLNDPRHVDQRRASMGLMPLADYKCMLIVMYSTPATSSSP